MEDTFEDFEGKWSLVGTASFDEEIEDSEDYDFEVQYGMLDHGSNRLAEINTLEKCDIALPYNKRVPAKTRAQLDKSGGVIYYKSEPCEGSTLLISPDGTIIEEEKSFFPPWFEERERKKAAKNWPASYYLEEYEFKAVAKIVDTERGEDNYASGYTIYEDKGDCEISEVFERKGDYLIRTGNLLWDGYSLTRTVLLYKKK